MEEKYLEQKLVHIIEGFGGLCLKLVCPGMAGVPDRLCLLLGGRAIFVEVKRPGERPRPLQAYRLKQLKKLGFEALVVDGLNRLEEVGVLCAMSHTATKD